MNERPTPETDKHAAEIAVFRTLGTNGIEEDPLPWPKFARRLERERDDAREALRRLHDAADGFAADQSRATDERVGLVQPVSVAECVELNEAIQQARKIMG